MRSILLFLLILSAQGFLSAEMKAQSKTSTCPSIIIRDRAGNSGYPLIYPGKDFTFTANIDGITPEDKPIFNWTISGGKIVKGQGTASITITTNGEVMGQEITMTVEINGVSAFTQQCDNRVSVPIRIGEYFCPNLRIDCPTYFPELGTPITVSVSISGGDPEWNPKYNWKVSAGKIISGQGTPVISVDNSNNGGQTVTATVEIDGLPPECQKAVSCSVSTYIIDRAPPSRKFDEYGDVNWIKEQARLAKFGIQLKQEPSATAYVIIYGPRRVARRLVRVRKFLAEKQGIDPERITLVNGGYNKKTKVEFWVLPIGAAAPKPDPNF